MPRFYFECYFCSGWSVLLPEWRVHFGLSVPCEWPGRPGRQHLPPALPVQADDAVVVWLA